jgi:hypothetical protein
VLSRLPPHVRMPSGTAGTDLLRRRIMSVARIAGGDRARIAADRTGTGLLHPNRIELREGCLAAMLLVEDDPRSASGHQKADGERGVDDELDGEVDRCQRKERDVDQVSYCPDGI